MNVNSKLAVAALLMSCLSALHAQTNDVSQASTTVAPSDLDTLKQQLAIQQKQIEQLQKALNEQHLVIERIVTTAPGSASGEDARIVNVSGSTMPLVQPLPAAALSPGAAAQAPAASADQPAPLQLKIGNSYITPVGFLSYINVTRSTDFGSGIGDNFGAIPFNKTAAGNLSENRGTAQNSRLGLRIDNKTGAFRTIGYLEADFLGNQSANVAVSTNSDVFRLRLYWVDVRYKKFEILGGQSWSLLTPSRKGLSPLPGDVFFTNDIDVNYQVGLAWGRVPGLRMVYHFSDDFKLGVALEQAEQYIGGSAGGSSIVLPTAFTGLAGTQLNNGASNFSVPNLHPDIIVKASYDKTFAGSRTFHLEAGGVIRTFKIATPTAVATSFNKDSVTGGAATVNMGVDLFRTKRQYARVFMNTYFGQGGGRYLFGQVPDLIVRGNGTLDPLKSGGTVDGIEFQLHPKLLMYAYYGGLYADRLQTIDPANNRPVGYGFTGSPNSQNRSIQEGSLGFSQTFWRDAKYGNLNFNGQYSYITRHPWYLAPTAPKDAYTNQVYVEFRYTLPGQAPTIK